MKIKIRKGQSQTLKKRCGCLFVLFTCFWVDTFSFSNSHVNLGRAAGLLAMVKATPSPSDPPDRCRQRRGGAAFVERWRFDGGPGPAAAAARALRVPGGADRTHGSTRSAFVCCGRGGGGVGNLGLGWLEVWAISDFTPCFAGAKHCPIFAGGGGGGKRMFLLGEGALFLGWLPARDLGASQAGSRIHQGMM